MHKTKIILFFLQRKMHNLLLKTRFKRQLNCLPFFIHKEALLTVWTELGSRSQALYISST